MKLKFSQNQLQCINEVESLTSLQCMTYIVCRVQRGFVVFEIIILFYMKRAFSGRFFGIFNFECKPSVFQGLVARLLRYFAQVCVSLNPGKIR